ncbi:MAG: 30S ribosomal protein S9 [Anaerolineae bacterium]|nr:30S ribosomal protein S9 [Anaerolineae bacterium]MCO5187345.1 30S ribosomal protein S9 [Anaerolineae bacterium]MCO5193931.1 30S ribosomal protein S9 [Anaerolineae bacterium]MCO5196258.1 30S ribosomal protein S9 [Anaerolineae bacterium]MCO5204452.1 30S ribosomal protein S9 [Anaerolineae bacterium]
MEELQKQQYFEGIGRRKRSTARVRIYPTGEGGGQFIVNGKEVKEYFTRFGDYETLVGPLTDTDFAGKMDVTVLVMGGGVTGQTAAVRLGLARALVKYDENLRSQLRVNNHMTRDPRVKERKKPGLKRARKAPTYTKR